VRPFLMPQRSTQKNGGESVSTVGRNIRHLRESRGLPLEAVAKRAGLSKQSVWAIERGSSPRIDTIEKLARAFSVPASELISENYEQVT
jgi:transcriptional regulator with XRE-family HTH domain